MNDMPTLNKSNRPPWLPEPTTEPHKRRTADMSRFYNSTAWRTDRSAHLRAFPLCAMCAAKGRLTEATVSDHIRPIRQGGDPWDWANRQALCKPCHDSKSGREAHQRGKEGAQPPGGGSKT